VCSPGDTAEQDAVAASGSDLLVLDEEPGRGDYAKKINLAYRESSEPYLFLGADDLHFHRRWLQRCLLRVEKGASVVGTNDLCNPRVMQGDHSTHSLVTRDYCDTLGTIDRPGQVLHDGYPHEYVDDEFVATAKHRGVFLMARDAHVEHLHPMSGKAPMDALYEQQQARMRVGLRIYKRRCRLWT
jgi:hypothetical protein